ncbi:hypothetical protein GDO81_029267 [Engystomops pustulosus]|uniref:Uncharacterized protein n=1 Tax=Engystomops pustulosus TaxID=76066 RepID=A0AAV6YDT5_ENGPU|nr:hypothetical protein GDO81_029267 [Engystomops pustulosus]
MIKCTGRAASLSAPCMGPTVAGEGQAPARRTCLINHHFLTNWQLCHNRGLHGVIGYMGLNGAGSSVSPPWTTYIWGGGHRQILRIGCVDGEYPV